LADQQSDYEFAVEYGKGGHTVHPPVSTNKQQHLGTEDEARKRDNAIIDTATEKADQGVAVPDSYLRRK
jgi:hypothetical protein